MPTTRAQPGFTLIETLAVLALLGLLATVVTVSLAGPRSAARIGAVVADLGACDRTVRERARGSNRPVRLRIDLDGGTVWRAEALGGDGGDGGDGGANGGRRNAAEALLLRLPAGYRFAGVVTPAGRTSAGTVEVACSGAGLSPSYAVHLSCPGQDRWVLVAGLSGQVSDTDDREVDSIFAAP